MIPGITGGRRQSRRGPSLELDFTRNDVAIDRRITFTRADATTCATRTRRYGGTPRALVNKYTATKSTSSWTLNNTTRALRSVATPSGAFADAVSNTPGSSSYISAPSTALANSTQYTRSVSAKPVVGNGLLVFEISTGTAFLTAQFNLLTGTLGSVSGGVTAAIGVDSDGWGYTCEATFSTAATGTPASGVHYIGAYGSTGTATTIALRQPQLETGAVRAPYQWVENGAYDTTPIVTELVTVAANMPRLDYDPVTLACRGLMLERSVQNTALNSRTAFSALSYNPNGVVATADYAVSPDGTVNASRMYKSAGVSAPFNFTGGMGSLVTGTAYAYSFWLKPLLALPANFNVYAGDGTSAGGTNFTLTVSGGKITAVNNGGSVFDHADGWQRVTLPFTASGNYSNANFTFSISSAEWDFLLWQRQHGSGFLHPTSAVFTDGTARTRAAESAVCTNLASIGWNANGWSGYVEWTQGAALGRTGDYGRVFEFSDNTVNNAIFIYQNNGTDNVRLQAVIGGVLQGQINFGSIAAGTTCCIAFRLTPTGFAASLNGGVLASVVCTVPMALMTKLNLCGAYNNSSNSYGDGYLREFTAWSRPLSDAELIEESTP